MSDSDTLEDLTAKQREVLDLLLEHKTSKEIAQVLKISPHTVDQRIQFAKRKLGVETRSDLANSYRRLSDVYGQTVYKDSRMFAWDQKDALSGQDNSGRLAEPERIESIPTEGRNQYNRVVPSWMEGRNGKWVRLILILAITFLAILAALGGIAIFASLSAVAAG